MEATSHQVCLIFLNPGGIPLRVHSHERMALEKVQDPMMPSLNTKQYHFRPEVS